MGKVMKEVDRMKRIDELFNAELGTPEGEEFSRLIDEQIACEESLVSCGRCGEKVPEPTMTKEGWFDYLPHDCVPKVLGE